MGIEHPKLQVALRAGSSNGTAADRSSADHRVAPRVADLCIRRRDGGVRSKCISYYDARVWRFIGRLESTGVTDDDVLHAVTYEVVSIDSIPTPTRPRSS